MTEFVRDTLKIIHFYISDILLGFQPWLNETTACTYPEPWKRAKGKRRKYEKKPNVKPNWNRPLPDFVGTYGHLAFGNITIELNSSDQKLHLYHGKFGHALLKKSEKPFTFDMAFIETLRYISEADGWRHSYLIQFLSSSNSDIDSIEAKFIEGRMPPIFKRGLKWQDKRGKQAKITSIVCSTNTGVKISVFSIWWLISIIPLMFVA